MMNKQWADVDLPYTLGRRPPNNLITILTQMKPMYLLVSRLHIRSLTDSIQYFSTINSTFCGFKSQFLIRDFLWISFSASSRWLVEPSVDVFLGVGLASAVVSATYHSDFCFRIFKKQISKHASKCSNAVASLLEPITSSHIQGIC